MKKMNRIYLFAALALAVACTVEPIPEKVSEEEAVPQDNIVTLVATLSPKTNPNTKALTDPGDGTLSSTWAVAEEIEVLYEKSTDPADSPSGSAKATVTAVDGSGNATISVDLVSPKEGDTGVYFHYPYCIAAGTKDIENDQIGTLADVSANFDEVTGDGTLNVSGGAASLASAVAMERNVCVWKFTFTDGSSDITSAVTALNIKVGSISEYNVTPSSQGTIYVAMFQANKQPVTVTATTAAGTFSRTTGAVSLAKGKLYTSTALALIKQNTIALGGLTANYTASNGDVLTGTLSAAYRVIIPNGATVTLNNATINHDGGFDGVDSYSSSAITCLGNATIILADGTTNSVTVPGGNTSGTCNYPGILVGGAGTKLKITGSGTLTAQGGYIAAGIGSMNGLGTSVPCGQIQIDGGTINAYSGNASTPGDGAETGIGSVMGGASDRCDGITINGGVVTAKGGSSGIGSGLYGDKCTFVTINGGEIYAEGGDCGISAETMNITNGYIEASSEWGYGIKTDADLTITGGNVDATGNGGNAGLNVEGNLSITGGTVSATGNEGGEGILCIAGLTSTITINGGTVTSTAAGNAGVGLEGSIIIINDGTVIAAGGDANVDSNGNGGAGIDGSLTVNGGVVTATGGAKDGTGDDGLGISGGSTIALSGVTMYEGDAPNPSVAAESQTACTKRYVKIQ